MPGPHDQPPFAPPRQGSVAPPGFTAAAKPTPPPVPGTPYTAVPVQAQLPADAALQQPPSSYGAVLALTMLLVGGALGLFIVGALLGTDLPHQRGRNLWLAGVGMLFAQGFVGQLRRGTVGMAWLGAAAFCLGLGFGPVGTYYVAVNPDALAEAAGMTVVVVLGAATYGTFTAHDLAAWMRPVSIALFGAVLVSWFAACGSLPILGVVIGTLSAVAMVLYFNYLRRHADEDDAVWLATGIFVGILNIFLSALRLGRP